MNAISQLFRNLDDILEAAASAANAVDDTVLADGLLALGSMLNDLAGAQDDIEDALVDPDVNAEFRVIVDLIISQATGAATGVAFIAAAGGLALIVNPGGLAIVATGFVIGQAVGAGVSFLQQNGITPIPVVANYSELSGDYRILGTVRADEIVDGMGDDTIESRGGADQITIVGGNNIIRAGDFPGGEDYVRFLQNGLILDGRDFDMLIADSGSGLAGSGTSEIFDVEAVGGSPSNDSFLIGGNSDLARVEGNGGDDLFVLHNGSLGVDLITIDGGGGSEDALDLRFSDNRGSYVNLDSGHVQFGSNGSSNRRFSVENVENIIGTDERDVFIGNAFENDIQGFGGRDQINGGSGFDRLEGGEGRDTINVGDDGGTSFGQADNDSLIAAGSGVETPFRQIEGSMLDGGSGEDTLDARGHTGGIYLTGGSENDILYGNGDADLRGGSGVDTYHALDGDDIVDGEGHDVLIVEGINVTERADTILTGVETFDSFGGSVFVPRWEGTSPLIDDGSDSIERDIAVVLRVDRIDSSSLISPTDPLPLSNVTMTVFVFTDVDLIRDPTSRAIEAFDLEAAAVVIEDFHFGDFGLFPTGFDQNVGVTSDGQNLVGPGALPSDSFVQLPRLDIEDLRRDYIIDGPQTLSEEALEDEARREQLSEAFDLSDVQFTSSNGGTAIGDDNANVQVGTLQNDSFVGAGGDDFIMGRRGSDTIDGGDGADVIYGEELSDFRYLTDIASTSLTGEPTGPEEGPPPGGDGDVVIADPGDLGDPEGGGGQPVGSVSNDDLIHGGAGDDTVYAGIGDDDVFGDDGDDDLQGDEGDDFIDGGSGRDSVYGGTGRDTLFGGLDGDRIEGDAGDDILDGGDGDDLLSGGSGDDSLGGNLGDDTVSGGDGADDYIYMRGEGSDRIEDLGSSSSDETDRLRFLDIDSTEVSYSRSGNDLLISVSDGASIVLVGQLAFDSARIEEIHFADGVVVNALNFAETNIVDGTAGNDVFDGTFRDDTVFGYAGDDHLSGRAGIDGLFGDEGNDTLDGGANDDLLNGGSGNDVLVGGTGNDTLEAFEGTDTLIGGEGSDSLYGGAGGDSFIFGSMFGNDIIFDLSTIDGDSIDLTAIDGLTSTGQLLLEEIDGGAILFNSGTATIIRLDLDQDGMADDDQSITVIGTMASELTSDVFNFAVDSTPAPIPTLIGTAGNDSVAGSNDDDVIDGGTGSDTIVGNLGDDYIIYSGGDDVIGRSNRGNDTLDLSAYAASDVSFSITGHDVLIETPDGTVRLDYQVRYELGNAQSNIEEIVFSDSTLDAAGIQGRALADQGTSGDDAIAGSYQNDTITAGLGDDTIRANSGDDFIVYEGGNDFVHRSNGGFDTLDLSDYTASDVSFSVSGHNVIVTTPDGAIELDYQVRYEFGNARSNIEEILFSDGTLDEAGIHGRAISDQGTSGSDAVTGSYQNDTIDAGLGDDTVRANSGDDFIFYSGGDDVIHRSNAGFDTLDLSGYLAADVTFSQDGHDVLIQTSGGMIELDYQVRYDVGDSRLNIEEIVFADGTLDEIGIRDRVDADALLV